jgi:pimeloyl-ACP methyl ester carboxylesterase
MSLPATAILVHGACHGHPAYFEPLVSWLTYQGISSVTTTCPSDSADPPTIGMYDDAAHVREVIIKEIDAGKDVLVFMHSYGGIVGTEAAKGLSRAERQKEGKRGGVAHMYYLCAFMLQQGESLISSIEKNPDLIKPAITFDVSYPFFLD